MVILWMCYAAALSAVIAGGALALEALAAIWGGRRRLVWLTALGAATLLPVAFAFGRSTPASVTADRVAAPTARAPMAEPAQPVRLIRTAVNVPVPRTPPRWDRYALAGWAAASIVLLGLTLRGFWIVRRRRTAWVETRVDEHVVLLASDVGPAVVGALRPRIVLPAWALALGDEERALMLRHEVEHVRAGDPAVLLVAAVCVALFPWNAALWLIARRLRLAIEIDCDARVLRALSRPREYGLLLLEVGARHNLSLPLAASLAERRPFLERRLVAMTALRPARPFVASLPFAALALVAAAAAAQTPMPAAPLRPAAAQSAPSPSAAPSMSGAPMSAPSLAPAAAPAPVTGEPSLATPTPPAAPSVAPAAAPSAPLVAPAPAPTSAPLAAPATAPTLAPLAPSGGIMMPRAAGAARATSCCDVSMDSLAAWMVRYHPNVVHGDTSVATVVFVIDASGKYVSSGVRGQVLGAQDSAAGPPTGGVMRGRVGGPGSAAAAGPSRAPVGTTSNAMIRSPRFMMGDSLVTNFNQTPIALDIPIDSIEGVQILKLPEGRLAPNRIGVVTIFLKP